mmetsp:Transcript_71954/g.153837  ORF Transcript_71954/g.153837 Transcript_71954/m.153837 type:complete len:709 (-) Transcript_71954:262-2388(-)
MAGGPGRSSARVASVAACVAQRGVPSSEAAYTSAPPSDPELATGDLTASEQLSRPWALTRRSAALVGVSAGVVVFIFLLTPGAKLVGGGGGRAGAAVAAVGNTDLAGLSERHEAAGEGSEREEGRLQGGIFSFEMPKPTPSPAPAATTKMSAARPEPVPATDVVDAIAMKREARAVVVRKNAPEVDDTVTETNAVDMRLADETMAPSSVNSVSLSAMASSAFSSASSTSLKPKDGSDVSSTTTMGVGGTSANTSCHTTVEGESCYRDIVWAMNQGIAQHPEWYGHGLTAFSSLEQFQLVLHQQGHKGCSKPCAVSRHVPAWHAFAASKADAQGSICNVEAVKLDLNVEEAAAPVWTLPTAAKQRCFREFATKGMEADDGDERNWCWAELKRSGCHAHLTDSLPWAESNRLSSLVSILAESPFSPLSHPKICDRRELGAPQAWTAKEEATARRWFWENVAVYVLTLPSSNLRRDTISERLLELQIPFSFVYGVDLREKDALMAAREEGLVPAAFNVTRARLEAMQARNDMGSSGSFAGTLGCAAGHFRAQVRALTSTPEQAITVIFEDDVSPEVDFIVRLWSVVTQELPCDWQAVSLLSRCPYGHCVSPHLTRVQPDVNEPAWRCRQGVNYGLQGMVYRTSEINNIQKKLKPVVFDEARPHCLELDVALASISDEVAFYAVPALQAPGFLRELHEGSVRDDINLAIKHI